MSVKILTSNMSDSLNVNDNQEFVEPTVSSESNCPRFTEMDKQIVYIFRYWISGVLLCGVGILGLVMNTIAIIILSSRAANRIFFNKLLISLFTFDCVYLLMEIIERVRLPFGLATQIHKLMYPYFLRPLTKVSLTSSIFMTIAIAYERYVAIKRPILHRQSLTSRRFRRRNLMKYICCVILWSIVLNVPIWFESEIKWQKKNSTTSDNTTAR